MSYVKDGSYINIQPFMVRDLELKGNELLIYAIIYGFSQDGESYFTGSIQYLADWTNSTRQGVIKVLKNLTEKGLLKKFETGKQTYAYQASKQSSLVNKVNQSTELTSTSKQSLHDQSTELTSTSKQSLHNNINNNINNNTNNNLVCANDNQEFRDDIVELKNIIANSTGVPMQYIEGQMKIYLYKDIIKQLLAKIKGSKYLMGEKEEKPKVFMFTSKQGISKIMAGNYDDFKTKNKAPNKLDTQDIEYTVSDTQKQVLEALGL